MLSWHYQTENEKIHLPCGHIGFYIKSCDDT